MRYAAIDLTDSFRDPVLVTERLSAALRTAVVVHVVNRHPLGEPLAYWADIVGRLGEPFRKGEHSETGVVREQDSIWIDVRFDPRYPMSFRHHNSAQPLHTDGAYRADVPNMTLFYCARQAAAGGATVFVDVVDLAAALRREHPDLYERLVRVKVEFSKTADEGRACTILSVDEHGPRVNWNYYRVAADQSPEVRELREAFQQVLARRFMDGPDTLPIALQPGEVVIFDDVRTLHGRHAYAAEQAGDRLIWKCYFTPFGALHGP